MPSLGDVVKITFVQELAGVQMANHQFLRIDDLGTNPSTVSALLQILTEYHDVVKATLSSEWTLSCGIYENQSAVEAKSIAFPNLIGTALGVSHPQDQVLRLNRYAVSVPPANGGMRVSAWNQSGVEEPLSTRGRVNDTSEFLALRNFLREQQIFGTEWTTTPMSRSRIEAVPPFTFQFNVVSQCLLNPTFLKLRPRKTNLCAA